MTHDTVEKIRKYLKTVNKKHNFTKSTGHSESSFKREA